MVRNFLNVRNDLTAYLKYHYCKMRVAAIMSGLMDTSLESDDDVLLPRNTENPSNERYGVFPHLNEDNELKGWGAATIGPTGEQEAPPIPPENTARDIIFKYEIRGGPSVRENIGPMSNARVRVYGIQRLLIYARLDVGTDEVDGVAHVARGIFEGVETEDREAFVRYQRDKNGPTSSPTHNRTLAAELTAIEGVGGPDALEKLGWTQMPPDYIIYEPAEYDATGLIDTDNWYLATLTGRFSYYNIYNTNNPVR